MKFSAIALAFTVYLAGPAVVALGDPRLIQGALEWPPALSSGETFIVIRSEDGRVYYADVMAAQRHMQGALSAGGRITLLGLEGIKPHEIIAVALGSGDAAALSLALAQASPTTLPTPPPPPSTASAAVLMVDISKLDPSIASRLRPGSSVTVVAVPVGNKFQATGVLEPETGTSGSAPATPPR